MFNLPALVRFQSLYFPFKGLQRPVFLLNSRLALVSCGPTQGGARHLPKVTPSFFAEFLELLYTARLTSLLAVYLCRFTVRILISDSLNLF